MYSKRNKILSVALVLVMLLLSLSGCKNPEPAETNTDTSSVIAQIGTVYFEDLCLWDYNDLSDFLESEKRSGKMFFNSEKGEYIKLFEDESLAKEITDYKTLLANKMVVQKYDKSGTAIATYTLVGEETKTDVSSQEVSSTSQGEKIVITVWGDENDRTLKEAVADYNNSSSVFEVKIITLPNGDIATRLKQAREKGNAPDVVYMDSANLKLLAQSGIICDLASSGIYESQGKFVSSVFNAMSVDGAVYGIPFDAETNCLAYNLDVFNFANIDDAPKTYDELLEDATKITETYSDKNAPIGLFDATDKQAVADTFISWLYRCGGTILSGDGKTAQFNSAMGERALTLIADLYKQNLASSDWTVSEFYSGKTTFFEVSSNHYNGTFGSGAKANFEAALFPSITNGENPSTFKVNGYGVVNNNDIVKMQGAYDFIVFYCTSEEYQTDYCSRNSKIPCLKDSQENNAFDNDNMKVFIGTLEDAECIPAFGGSGIIKEYIADAVLSVINDNLSVSDALSKAAQKTNNRLGRN